MMWWCEKTPVGVVKRGKRWSGSSQNRRFPLVRLNYLSSMLTPPDPHGKNFVSTARSPETSCPSSPEIWRPSQKATTGVSLEKDGVVLTSLNPAKKWGRTSNGRSVSLGGKGESTKGPGTTSARGPASQCSKKNAHEQSIDRFILFERRPPVTAVVTTVTPEKGPC